MTELRDPAQASVFIVGRNQATPFPVAAVGEQDEYLDALFNRPGSRLSSLYATMRARLGKGPSPTRINIQALADTLSRHGLDRLLETNVICYSTPMSADLALAEHLGGADAGRQVFIELADIVRPGALIAHGAGTRTDLEQLLGTTLPSPPASLHDDVSIKEVKWLGGEHRMLVAVIPSLAPPAWNKWSRWAPTHFERLATALAQELQHFH